jgi:predicted nucleic acid-binding protein
MSEPSPRLVVDASVAFKWFVIEGEEHVQEAWRLLEGHRVESTPLVAPDLLRLEVLNALKSRRVPEPAILRAADALDGFRLEWRQIGGALSRTAAEIALQHRLSLYDAAYAALALELDAELVTADRRLAESGACRIRLLGDS